jgi:hypothetical protein
MPATHTATIVVTLVALSCAAHAQHPGWRADPKAIAQSAKQHPEFNFDESAVPDYALPDVVSGRAGMVRTAEQWPARRAEILELFRQHVYGRSAALPQELRFKVVEENPTAMGGAATLKRVRVMSANNGREFVFELTMFLPNARGERVGLFLFLNNRAEGNTDPTRTQKSGFWPAEQVIARGYGIAAIQVEALALDDRFRYRDAAIWLFEGSLTPPVPRPTSAWGALAAWAWGASRAMDYLVTDPRVDPARVAVVGHSRGGKAALWAGAEDERFSMVISNESGEGGAALSRRHFGETLARITTSFPHWFNENYATFAGRVDALPVDQHMLLALMAPRALYVASADEDLWADPRGEFLSLAHTSPAYALWGDAAIGLTDMPPLEQPLIVGRRGYHVRRGTHNLTPYDWDRFADFADKVWR